MLQKAVVKHNTDLNLLSHHKHYYHSFCTITKMEDDQSQVLDNLTDKINSAHLRGSQSDSMENGVPDTGESPRMDEMPTLSKLAGELQTFIVTSLHPSAVIALSQTNHHFHSCANLHRLPFCAVLNYLQQKEWSPSHSNDYACYTCLRASSVSRLSPRDRPNLHGASLARTPISGPVSNAASKVASTYPVML